MPICKKCKNSFPNRIEIEGKLRNVKNRKYCLICSPFGKHNTRRVHIDDVHCVCKVCGKTFAYSRGKGHTYNICGSCIQKSHREKRNKMAMDYKGGKCVICGYHKCTWALEFHHLNPKDKSFPISTEGHKKSWKVFKKELDKCILVCANCHREIEAGLIKVKQEGLV